MKTYAYAATFEPTEKGGGFTVTSADVPEAITEGSMADARAMAADALGLALLTYLETGRPLPAPAAAGTMITPEPESRHEDRRHRDIPRGRDFAQRTCPPHGQG